jgi:hypothetical protein
MSGTPNQPENPGDNSEPVLEPSPHPAAPGAPRALEPREVGGRPGPDPTRYGDWEKAGRCIDF